MRISDWSSDVCSSDLRSNTGDDAATMLLRGGADLALVNGIIVSPTQTCLRIDSSATVRDADTALQDAGKPVYTRSEEYTSELQSLMRISYAVFCVKKKTEHSATKHHNPIQHYYPEH